LGRNEGRGPKEKVAGKESFIWEWESKPQKKGILTLKIKKYWTRKNHRTQMNGSHPKWVFKKEAKGRGTQQQLQRKIWGKGKGKPLPLSRS